MEEEIQRRDLLGNYLNFSSKLREPPMDFMQYHVKELGARIAQDILAGLIIAPVFTYQPFLEGEQVMQMQTSTDGLTSGRGSKEHAQTALGKKSARDSDDHVQRAQTNRNVLSPKGSMTMKR